MILQMKIIFKRIGLALLGSRGVTQAHSRQQVHRAARVPLGILGTAMKGRIPATVP